MVADKAYRSISPVSSLHADKRTVRMIPRASLVNAQRLFVLALANVDGVFHHPQFGDQGDQAFDRRLRNRPQPVPHRNLAKPMLSWALFALGRQSSGGPKDVQRFKAVAKARACELSTAMRG
jgi:hypothetical protein